MSPLPAILALLTGVAGWFYLFYSRAAQGLSGIEQERWNRRRIGLRRIGGVVMLLLAVGFYLGFYGFEPERRPRTFLGVWLGVIVLLGVLVLLALIDVRLTLRIRGSRREQQGFPVDRTPPP
jgi:UDP-N-acetylmuramyl pentapeptide phosphotransferase/UDP-N-acetylglucosamine-1-phosphate transferase